MPKVSKLPKMTKIKEFCPFKLIERSDSINPKSLRGVGPYALYGPEAAI